MAGKPQRTRKSSRTTLATAARQYFRAALSNPLLLWCLGLFLLLGLMAFPISANLTRLVEVILFGALAAGALALCWTRRILRWALVALYVGCAVFVLLPGHTDYDRIALRQETARALLRYEGTRYYGGGKGFLGIDGSGLVRRGIIDALFLHGVRHLNPWLVRRAALVWWTDLSARELGSGARGRTRLIKEVPAIKGMDESHLDPGDFAITRSGVQAFAFLGNHHWIEADPQLGKVIQVDARSAAASGNPWFQEPVSIHRWRMLDLERRVGRQP